VCALCRHLSETRRRELFGLAPSVAAAGQGAQRVEWLALKRGVEACGRLGTTRQMAAALATVVEAQGTAGAGGRLLPVLRGAGVRGGGPASASAAAAAYDDDDEAQQLVEAEAAIELLQKQAVEIKHRMAERAEVEAKAAAQMERERAEAVAARAAAGADGVELSEWLESFGVPAGGALAGQLVP
jgi:hypothetical protein